MKLLITGASGFLGKYVTAAALRKGHQVRAVVRPASDIASIPWADHPNVELARFDLRRRAGIADSLVDIDAVIHLAAAKAGDFYAQFAGTVLATENLLAAMVEKDVKRLVAISTFSVYDYINIESEETLDELSPLVKDPASRDEYAQTKLLQEQLVRDFESQQGGLITVLRPGVIYGRDNLWTARLGAGLGESWWLRIGAQSQLPLSYVENCADAIAMATEQKGSIGQTINIFDDNPPTQREYAKQLRKQVPNPPKFVPMNWMLMRSIGDLAWFVNQKLLGGKAKLPGVLIPSRLDARFKPLQYSNEKLKTILGWQPRYVLEDAIARSLDNQNHFTVPATPPVLSESTGIEPASTELASTESTGSNSISLDAVDSASISSEPIAPDSADIETDETKVADTQVAGTEATTTEVSDTGVTATEATATESTTTEIATKEVPDTEPITTEPITTEAADTEVNDAEPTTKEVNGAQVNGAQVNGTKPTSTESVS